MYHSAQDGIHSSHEFSAGANYDPSNLSFGPVIGLDEHLVSPGAGFDWHAHRGVHIVSWVLDGQLRHEDSTGTVRVLAPGRLLVQTTGDGIRHTETNASEVEALRFLQVTVLGDGQQKIWVSPPPVEIGGVRISIYRDGFATSGAAALVRVLRGGAAGETIRIPAGDAVAWPAGPELAVVELMSGLSETR